LLGVLKNGVDQDILWSSASSRSDLGQATSPMTDAPIERIGGMAPFLDRRCAFFNKAY